ncbi:MAG: efflux RND transporter periplasmic adaptor subunit [Paludibacteraceae bacterium]|nr:efflux RND transporter periplasmic adaptor subunit [Paludibacteraceae bacterium]
MKKLFLFTALIVMLFCGCGNDQQNDEIPEKKVMTIHKDSCTVVFEYPAQLKGRQDINVVPQVEALLEQVLVKEGDKVKKGQRLFVLAQDNFNAQLRSAQAGVQSANAMLESAKIQEQAKKQLFDKGIISKNQYDVAKNDLDRAKATLAEAQSVEFAARTNLGYTIVKAPSDGVVGNIYHRQGALVGPAISEPLTVVSDNSVVYAYISISEAEYISRIKSYDSKDEAMDILPECQLRLSDGSIYNHKGKVETLSGIIDESTGSISVRIAYDNPQSILTAGGSAVVLIPYSAPDAIMIPRTATFEIQDKVYVYRLREDGGKTFAESVMVNVYRVDEDNYVVLDGLNDGDRIVLEGVRKMINNAEIKPIE